MTHAERSDPTVSPPRAPVGRAAELEAIDRFLNAATGGPAALLLLGEAGIGKTMLFCAGVVEAQRRGGRVLLCTTSPAETRLSYAGLADLLDTIGGRAFDQLPPPQREALEVALLRRQSNGPDIDQRAVATAVLSVLEDLAQAGPVVVAIDDLRWLDAPTLRVVQFCTRRLRGPVGVLAAERVGATESATGAIRLHDADRADVRRLPPLRALEIEQLLRAAGAAPAARRALARIQEAAGGNPFYALELARSGSIPGAAASPVVLPSSLHDLVDARLSGLDPAVDTMLLAAALLAEPTVELLGLAVGSEAPAAIEVAEERGLVVCHGARVRFTHPLLAIGASTRASAARRREMHHRLAGVVADIEERARHLALGAVLPDAIAALSDAARYARARGAPDAAAELLELALELGPTPALQLQAAQHHFDAGDLRRARALLEDALPALSAGRPQALLLLAEVHYKDDSFPAARTLLEQAQLECQDDEHLRVRIDLRLSFTVFNSDGPAAATTPARAAVSRAERLDDPQLLAQALAAAAMVDFLNGSGIDRERLEQALALEGPDLRAPSEFHPSLVAAFISLWTGELDDSRHHVRELAARHAAHGDELALAWAGFIRVWLECWAGDLARADIEAEKAMERLLRLETSNGRALALTARAQVDAHRGRAAPAREAADEAIVLFERSGWQAWSLMPTVTLGFLALSIGESEVAVERLMPVAQMVLATGLGEPTAGPALVLGDAAEALVATGRTEEAEGIVALLEERGATLDRARTIALAARCRGLVLAAHGDLVGAVVALERAIEVGARLPMPIERGRSLLVLGRVQRRRRRRLAAKAVLEEALGLFEAAGSLRWAEQAAAEIDCLGLRPVGAPDRLTPSEERTAKLAASGLTNHEVAASLVVSVKTVEAHLARAYRKLGIHSRAQLGALMGRREPRP